MLRIRDDEYNLASVGGMLSRDTVTRELRW